MEDMTMTEIARLIEGLRSAGWEEKKKKYTRKNLAVLFFSVDCFSFCLPFLCLGSYDIFLSRL